MNPLTRGWVVAVTGLGINLCLGVLSAWGVIAETLVRPASDGGRHLWTAAQASSPNLAAIVCFALTMVFAGRLQDRFGPRWVATAGGVLIGLGMTVASLSPVRLSSPSAFPFRMVLGFGVLTGIGIGLAYASTTPAAVKWFSSGRKGLVVGVVVSGFGFASLVTMPLTGALVRTYGVSESFLFLGVVLFVAVVGLAQLVANPPPGYVPPGSYSEERPVLGPTPAPRDYTGLQTLRTPSFYVLWAMFACVTCAGLMVIGIITGVSMSQLGSAHSASTGYLLALALGLGNGLGRPLMGHVSDRIGRQHTMLGVFAFQAALMMGLQLATSAPALFAFAFFIGLNYGASLTLFPATVFDFFGMRHAGINYGLLFTAWGFGGVLGALVTTWLVEHGWSAAAPGATYSPALTIAAALCLVGAALTFLLRAPDPTGKHCPVVEPGAAARQA